MDMTFQGATQVAIKVSRTGMLGVMRLRREQAHNELFFKRAQQLVDSKRLPAEKLRFFQKVEFVMPQKTMLVSPWVEENFEKY